jgi:hypothetical protein
MAHLEMPPTRIPLLSKGIGNPLKLVRCHFWKLIKVHNGPTSGLGAADDVAACRLLVSLSVETVAEVNGGVGTTTKGLEDCTGGSRMGSRQARHEV